MLPVSEMDWLMALARLQPVLRQRLRLPLPIVHPSVPLWMAQPSQILMVLGTASHVAVTVRADSSLLLLPTVRALMDVSLLAIAPLDVELSPTPAIAL